MSESMNSQDTEHQAPELKVDLGEFSDRARLNLNTARELSDEEASGSVGLAFFVNSTLEERQNALDTAKLLLAYQQSLKEYGEDHKTTKDILRAYQASHAEHYPNKTDDELKHFLTTLFNFESRLRDKMFRTDEAIPVIENMENCSSAIPVGTDKSFSYVTGLKPAINDRLSISELMSASFGAAANVKNKIRLVLPNSFIKLDIIKGRNEDKITLINEIVSSLVGFGEKYFYSSVMLEKAGIGKIILDYVLNNTIKHSVKGITDPMQLKPYIRSNDIPFLAASLLKNFNPDGTHFVLRCLANQCNATTNMLIDVNEMIRINDKDMSPEQRQALYDLVNKDIKHTPEELAALQTDYSFQGVPVNNVVTLETPDAVPYNVEIVIRPTNAYEYFACYDRIQSKINPKMRELAAMFGTTRDFNAARRQYMGTQAIIEMIQWVNEYRTVPKPGSDYVGITIKREEDGEEFDKGIQEIFNNNEQFAAEVITQIVNKAPYLTYFFFGVFDDTCPSCKKTASNIDTSETQESHRGFTPIDPIMNFFALTQVQNTLLGDARQLIEASLD